MVVNSFTSVHYLHKKTHETISANGTCYNSDLYTVQAKNFHGSSDICLMGFIYSI